MQSCNNEPMHDRLHKTSVTLVEGNPLAAEILRSVLAKNNIYAVEHCKSVVALADKIKEGAWTPQTVILDFGSFAPVREKEISVLRAITNSPFILVSEGISQDRLCSLIYAGINGFLTYDDVQDNLCSAIHCVVRGQLWFDKDVLEAYVHFISGLNRKKMKTGAVFTTRQQQIMALLKEGLANKEISVQLKISESTVKFHIAKIFAKLDVHDRRSVMKLRPELLMEGQSSKNWLLMARDDEKTSSMSLYRKQAAS